MHYEYQVGGSLKLNAPSYVTRRADTELYNAIVAGEFCYVFNARQMGKSSLRVRTQHQLRQVGIRSASLDMTSIGSQGLTPQQWYKTLAADLLRTLNLWNQVNLKTWWQEHSSISPLRQLNLLIEEIIEVHYPHEHLVIFVDEVDSALSLNFPVDDFFALIRYCYNQRADQPTYNRLTWALFGVTIPSDLMRDRHRTPFNIGRAIELQGFQEDEAVPLVAGLTTKVNNAQGVLREILHWTKGQPFLTQKLCRLVVEAGDSGNPCPILIPAGTEGYWVEQIVQSQIIDHWTTQDQPEHLRTIRDRLLYNEAMAGRLLGIYQRILAGEKILNDDSPEHIELLLSGLVVAQHSVLQVKNPIYQKVFSPLWVTEQLENLRPYTPKFNAWLGSQQQNESYLLQGAELQKAMVWKTNRMLSDLDYRFISASQDFAKRSIETDLAVEKLEREKAQFALQAAQDARQILLNVHQSARNSTKNLRLGRRWIAGIATVVTSLIFVLRLTGMLQGVEWMVLDRFFQLRPPAAVDPRITLVEIAEADLQRIGQYPMSDRVLATSLKNLQQYQPQSIGLDIYRDLSIAPGLMELNQILQDSDNIIGIHKIAGERVGQSPILMERNQVGFADQILDGDGKVRRALLSVRAEGKVQFSLGLRLAIDYLKTKGIVPQPRSNHSYQMQLGQATLVPFRSNDGGYVRTDAAGYQILMNFRGTRQQFMTLSMTDVLANRIPAESVRDRIVLIGYTAESVNDLFQTPYASRIVGVPTQMSGVVLHANAVSQLIDAALGERPLLRGLDEPVEWLWIFLGATVGAALAWQIKTSGVIALAAVMTIAGMVGGAYLAFLQGLWLPVVPASLSLAIAAVVLPNVATQQLEKIQLRQTIRLLVSATQQHPTAGRIAIEYLKQSESKENQKLIEEFLAREFYQSI
ncbi:MAG: CHASE2 domain-containing protein [Leptolyngbyaceae cyanobacterium CSU_1_4]|nr:CHASE2 domain-containing protein [Leptolyngbyaceae cyanobacterium CSU_1_4]